MTPASPICRCCGEPLPDPPLLTLENMPAAAQNFPAADELATEHGADLRVRQCECCGLVQLDCEPVPYFRDVIRAAAASPEMREFRLWQFSQPIQIMLFFISIYPDICTLQMINDLRV